MFKWGAIIVAAIIHTATIVWWAATVTNEVSQVKADVGELVETTKEVVKEQRNYTVLIRDVRTATEDIEKVEARLLALERRYLNPLSSE